VTLPGAVVEESLFAPFVQDDRPSELARSLNLPFQNLALLRLALTHRSILHEWATVETDSPLPHSNERLEFLGDAYLGMIVAEELFHRAPDAQEGELTSWRVSLVRAERLVSWAREIKLGSYLYLGSGERITEGARDRMLAGAFEALIGAIALDSGLEAARDFVLRFVDRDLAEVLARKEHANPKGQLQEFLQERFRIGPTYRIIRLEGPDHARLFTSEARFFDHPLGQGDGASKRDAEQAAARNALSRILDAKSDTLGILASLVGTHNDPRTTSNAAGAPGREDVSDQGNLSDFSTNEFGQQRERA
jgi:ribonuclease-3